jgi:hypothetical protein
MNRREFQSKFLPVFGSIVFPGLTGCASTFKLDSPVNGHIDGCGTLNDIVDRSLCRQKALASQATGYITVGMMVGAALGAAAAPFIKINPLLPIILGSIAGGAIAAADIYFRYRLEQANGDVAIAFQDIRRDIGTDLARSQETIKDIMITRNEAAKALSSQQKSLYAQSLQLDRIHALATEINNNKKTYLQCPPIYLGTQKASGRFFSSEDRERIKAIEENAYRLEQEERHYMALRRRDGHLR